MDSGCGQKFKKLCKQIYFNAESEKKIEFIVAGKCGLENIQPRKNFQGCINKDKKTNS
jgi:hypothetical protein